MSNSIVVALIPARSGSKRVPRKNIRVLGAHPLIAYSICAAKDAGIFDDVIVSTDSEGIAELARHYGASVPFLRPSEIAGDLSPDVDWVEDVLTQMKDRGSTFDYFSILRITSPFRTAATIRRAWDQFRGAEGVDSLRAVERCKQHPGKMWIVTGRRMVPLLALGPAQQPWHSSQYQTLPEVYVQNASLEIARAQLIFESRTIAGEVVMPFFTEGHEGFDINEEEDWQLAEGMLSSGEVELPPVTVEPFPRKT